MSKALQPTLAGWCVSVVAGKDAVPRSSTNNLRRLMDEMITALARSRCAAALPLPYPILAGYNFAVRLVAACLHLSWSGRPWDAFSAGSRSSRLSERTHVPTPGPAAQVPQAARAPGRLLAQGEPAAVRAPVPPLRRPAAGGPRVPHQVRRAGRPRPARTPRGWCTSSAARGWRPYET